MDSVFIGNNGGPSISLVSSNTLCYNDSSGQISTNVSGGTAPYTYLWDDGTNQTTATAVGLNVGLTFVKYPITMVVWLLEMQALMNRNY